MNQTMSSNNNSNKNLNNEEPKGFTLQSIATINILTNFNFMMNFMDNRNDQDIHINSTRDIPTNLAGTNNKTHRGTDR